MLAFLLFFFRLSRSDENNSSVAINGIDYILDQTTKTATIKSEQVCPTTQKTLTIPSKVSHQSSEYTVTKIDERAFFGCNNYIGDLVIPSSVTEIGGEAFSKCTGFNGKLEIHAAVNIHASIFSGCTGWQKEVIIGDEVTGIEVRAFDGLLLAGNRVTIGSGCQKVGSMSFFNCKLAGDLTIPKSVTILGNQFIGKTTGIQKLTIDATLEVLTAGAMTNIQGIQELIIGPNVQSLGEYCFANMDYLPKIDIGTSVQQIYRGAFVNSVWKQPLAIPQSVTFLDIEAFANSTWVGETAIIDAAVDEIETSVFSNIKLINCRDVYINNAKAIGPRAFDTLFTDGNETSVHLGSSITTVGSMAFHGNVLNTINLPTTLITTGSFPFSQVDITNMNIAGEFKDDYFEGGTKIENLVYDGTSITKGMFNDFKVNVSSFVLGSKVTTIESEAFTDCRSFANIIIPHTVTNIKPSAFKNCLIRGQIVFNATVKAIETSWFEGSLFTEIVFANSNIQEIASHAFMNSNLLGEVFIPSFIKKIGVEAFKDSRGIGSLYLNSSGIRIESNAFFGCSQLKRIRYCGSQELLLEAPSEGNESAPSLPAFDLSIIDTIEVTTIYPGLNVFGIPATLIPCDMCGMSVGAECLVMPTMTPTATYNKDIPVVAIASGVSVAVVIVIVIIIFVMCRFNKKVREAREQSRHSVDAKTLKNNQELMASFEV
ncbi:hypothetical protein TRFO_03680 [Tritrichomonas foetus]|uniref:Surface antigen BspA-like n=1 Tax=Tritrichomonas foetus TaxID=1144522 RepID=A0A1J4KL98_9EUKA|nr:hypothetical protein TRFO_03680 [Tritrichomonas foetus]|eukprot:OHT12073.1 hypothetical protein TRFO_03680 [Tritrichomonas foetus]